MYSIKRAVEITGISAGTLRAWEQRYGVGNPARSASGYRLYDARTIDELRMMQQLLDAGWTHQEAAHAVIRERERPTAPPPSHDDTLEALTGQFLAAATALDAAALNAVLDDAFSRGSFESIVDRWLMPALRAMGSAWIDGGMDIAGEHFASSAIMRRLGAALDGAGIASTAPKVLMGTPAGSLHEMGSLALAAAARRRGVHAVYLGANVPTDSWVEAVHRHTPLAVVISIVMPGDQPSAQETVDALLAQCPGVRIILGGPAADGVSGATATLRGGIGEGSATIAALMQGIPQSR